jgi:FixJ family two-component response regulator
MNEEGVFLLLDTGCARHKAVSEIERQLINIFIEWK